MSATVIILGNVTHDPELTEVRTSRGVTHKLRIPMASNPDFKTDDTGPTFFACEMWGKRAAALSEHVGKGDKLQISGELVTKEWTNREGEQKKSQIVKIDRLSFAGAPRMDPAFEQPRTRQQPARSSQSFDESIPF